MGIEKTTSLITPYARAAHCNTCHHETNHMVLYGERAHWQDVDADIYWADGATSTMLLKCQGCGTIHMAIETWHGDDRDDDNQVRVHASHYPATISRRRPEWLNDIPMWDYPEVAGLLREIYTALDNNQPRLAAMGTRALVEHIMLEKVGDRHTFAANVQAFVDEGYLARKDQDDFEQALIEAGHAAMHRSYRPQSSDLAVLMDLTENLVARLYVHPSMAKDVASRIPPRKTKGK